jgi:hypothetical protein
MTLHASLVDDLTRWLTFSSWILLFVWLCACAPDETVNATALRFAVYSDAELSLIKASVLNGQGDDVPGKTLSFPSATELRESSGTNYLFSLTVELTDKSDLRDRAVVRFDGYRETKLVLSQTVQVDFADKDTRLVRIWLARTCANAMATTCAAGFSCDPLRGECAPSAALSGDSYATASANETRGWIPPGYIECGPSDRKCPASSCSHAQDADCPLPLGAAECSSDAQCESGYCERGCFGEACALQRCCQERCNGPCAFCDDAGACQQFVNTDQVANCGACGNVCPSGPHGESVCRAGRCEFACEAGFEDCMSEVAGCETDLRTSPDHCGSCAAPDSSCRYRRCRDGKCLGTLVPVLPSNTSTQFTGLYLRRVVKVAEQVLAVGVNFMEAGGKVRLMLLADEMGKPGEILRLAELPVLAAAVSDAQGVLRGTEYVFETPVSQDEAAFWIGVESQDAGAVRLVQLGDMAIEALVTPTMEPVLGAKLAPDDVTILAGSLGASPYVYAVSSF